MRAGGDRTFGTVQTYPKMLGQLLRSLTTLDVDVLVAVGEKDTPADFALETGQVKLTPFVPKALLVEGASVVVHHGGAGNTFGMLAKGLPSVVVPQGADQVMMADKVNALGAGLSFPLGQTEVEPITAAVRKVLHDPAFAAGARRVLEEINSMPSADEVAEWLTAAASGQQVEMPVRARR